MRILTTFLSTIAVNAFAIAPAAACTWDKTASVKKKMTVAQAPFAGTPDDVAIGTNDLSDKVLQEEILLPVPGDKPTGE